MISMELSFGRMIALMGLPSFIFVFLVTLLTGAILLPLLRKLAVGQQVREDGPKTHLKKSGTPTFGGLMFLIPLLIMGIVFPTFPVFKFLLVEKAIAPLTAIAIFTLCIGIVGFIDDYIKVRVNKNGLSATVKSILLMIVISGYTVYYLYFSGVAPYILLPFSDLSQGGTPIELVGIGKIIYGLIIAFILYVTSNSVNITDGVDGLAASVTTIVSVTLGVMGASLTQGSRGTSLNSIYSISSSFYAFALAAGCLAFFMYNRHPAKIFMGDTGSQALGAAIAACSVLMGIPWVLIPIGIIYVMESLSVIIQVTHYKRTKERVFRMAPLHHHFELGGWSEWKVIGVFCIVTLIGCGLGLWMVL